MHQSDEIVKYFNLIYSKNYTTASGGNISILDGNTLVASPTEKNKGFLKSEDMVEIDFTTGKLLNNNRPTCEINMHLGIYKNRPDVKTIFHAHPIYTSVFSVLDTPLDLRLLSEAFIFLKKISYVDYAMPSSQELANKVSEKAKEANVLILRNHGAVVLGSNCEECFHKLEVLETLARIQYLILGRKDVHFISDDEMKRITENFHG